MQKEQKNSFKKLNDSLFRVIDRLDDETLSASKLQNEIARANAISSAGKVIIQTVKTKTEIARLKGGKVILADVGIEYE